MEEMVRGAMKRLDSLMEDGVKDYQEAKSEMSSKGDVQALIALDKDFLPIIERIGVTIADMYRLVEKKNPA